ncbi:hypothetical protein PRIPAC_74989 [Pristionchus pacificus]|uniref:Uncharacterized protein n=1 Tax=Pristionchus pacificus TaxID=54126 RepID=A0A2A6BRU6_PRIPA|nr:hypothetical protein PRIPAC_74989 [Pristionchus pacificus]|eukprot:PDM68523.1 hypothetical protein PRIPAC_44025 [Pristionchus pacificus]
MYPPPPPPKSVYYSQPQYHRSSSCTRGTTIVMAAILLFGHACMWLSATYFLFALFGPHTVFLFNYQTAAVILTTVGILGAARRNTGCLIAFIIHLVFALIGCVITFIGAILAVTLYGNRLDTEHIVKFYRRRSLQWNPNWFVPAMIILMILLFFSFVYNDCRRAPGSASAAGQPLQKALHFSTAVSYRTSIHPTSSSSSSSSSKISKIPPARPEIARTRPDSSRKLCQIDL